MRAPWFSVIHPHPGPLPTGEGEFSEKAWSTVNRKLRAATARFQAALSPTLYPAFPRTLETMSLRILVVEDDPAIADFLVRGLHEEGYSVAHAADGDHAQRRLNDETWDVILLDCWLPKLDGITVLRRFRQQGGPSPVLLLTARDAVADRVHGLESGADDYLCKPFAFAELLARIRALSRRQPERGTLLSYANINIDLSSQQAERAGKWLHLTAKELSLLACFLRHPETVLTRSAIYEHVWNEQYDGQSNTLEVHIKELRRKLEIHGPRVIFTLRGRGYVLRDPSRGRIGAGVKLATRISLFFLVTLAIVLASFSASIYWLVRSHLLHQLDERSLTALDTLSAAIDSGPGGLEWEGGERHLVLSTSAAGDALSWSVFDRDGRKIAGDDEFATFLAEHSQSTGGDLRLRENLTRNGDNWRITRREIRASPLATADSAAMASSGDEPGVKQFSAPGARHWGVPCSDCQSAAHPVRRPCRNFHAHLAGGRFLGRVVVS